MVKRRLAIVATAVVLGLGGMAGSALADDGPVRVHGGHGEKVKVHKPDKPVLYSGRLTCWTSDGEAVRFSKAKVAELVDEQFIEPELAETVVEDGVMVVPADRLAISVPAGELPAKVRGKVAGKRWHHKRVIHLTCVWDDVVKR
ncbi:hypothetical protein ACBJ59_20595 [Nonomuraea sp. MTCD27]|uniref:hypothetical protein n=1 Tax=Nonomuraea sp. MTCD27 TaxID=1676747 RepID=UPI0035BF01A5